MKKNLPTLLISAFTVLVIGGLVVLALKQPSTTTPTAAQPAKVGNMAVDFTLPDLSNKSYTLSSFKGKSPVIVEFFAVWCPHCQRMAPIVENLYKQYNTKIQFLNVQASPYGKNYESGDTSLATINDLKWFRDNFNISYPILQDYNTKTADIYGIQGFPTFYIIDKTGKITYTTSGETTATVLSDQINKVIGS